LIVGPWTGKGSVELTAFAAGKVSGIQLWLHCVDTSTRRAVAGRRESSEIARRLLGVALAANGIHLTAELLVRPALELFKLIQEHSGVEVSLAHCRGLVMAGLAPGRIGIDCERPGRKRSWCAMADLYFSADEARAIRSLPEHQREAAFLRHWILKESMVKATRGSVFTNLNRLVVESSGEDPRARTAEPGTWFAWQGQLGDCAAGLVCAPPDRPGLRLFECPDPCGSNASAECFRELEAQGPGLFRLQ
jgi:phosphopantetheinyl transferase